MLVGSVPGGFLCLSSASERWRLLYHLGWEEMRWSRKDSVGILHSAKAIGRVFLSLFALNADSEACLLAHVGCGG